MSTHQNVLGTHIHTSCVCEIIQSYVSIPDRLQQWMEIGEITDREDTRVVHQQLVLLYGYDPSYIRDDREPVDWSESTSILWVHDPCRTRSILDILRPRTLVLLCMSEQFDVTRVIFPPSVQEVCFICPWLHRVGERWL